MKKKTLNYMILFLAIIFVCLFFVAIIISKSKSEFSNLSYCAIGDSITYGFTPNSANIQMPKPYPNQVGKILKLKATYNLGISGSTLTNVNCGMSRRLNEIPKNSNIISVFGDTNDHSNNAPLGTINDVDDSTIYGALNVICTHLKTNFPNAFCFLITPYTHKFMQINPSGYSLYHVRDCILKIGEKYEIPVLNFTDNENFEIEMNTEINDGLHPSQNFVLKYTAPQIANFIKDNYAK